jgi:hypothetical protein
MDYFFNHPIDLRKVLEEKRIQLKQDIEKLDANQFLNTNRQELIKRFTENYQLKVPAINDDETVVDPQEVDIDVRNLPSRVHFSGFGSPFIRGTRFVFSVPFDGDAELFQFTPSTYNSMHPRAQVQSGHLDIIIIESPSPDSKQVESQFDSELGKINQRKH